MWTRTRKSHKSRRHHSSLKIEPLESRRVLATLVNGTLVTYQDVDGDNVTVLLSKPLLNAGNVNNIFKFNTGSVNGDNSAPQQLWELDLTSLSAAFAGGNLTIIAKPSASGGDAFVN